jgi:hypothetical protein
MPASTARTHAAAAALENAHRVTADDFASIFCIKTVAWLHGLQMGRRRYIGSPQFASASAGARLMNASRESEETAFANRK